MPAPKTPPEQQPDSPREQPPRPRPRSRRGGARLYSPGSDATTRRLVTASERRARRERQQASDDREAAREASEPAGSGPASTAVKTAKTTVTSSRTGETPETGETREDRAKARAQRRREARAARENRRGPLLPVALAVATLVLGGLAAWFGAEAHSLTSVPAASNSALTDTAATSAVRSQIGSAVTTLFSYNYTNPGPTTRAAKRLLTGPAVHQYATLFAQVHKDAPGQKLVVSTVVTSVGVELLTGDQARLLVFATETDTRAGGGQRASVGAMLAVNAVRQGGTWKIEDIDTY